MSFRPATSTRGPPRSTTSRRGHGRTTWHSTATNPKKSSSLTRNGNGSVRLHRSHCLELPVSRLSRSSASLWQMACRRPTISVASSVPARRLSTRYESCAPTACVTRRCRPSTGRSSWPSYCMHPVLGPASSERPTDSESTHFSAAARAAATVRRTCRRSKSCWRHPTSSSSTKYNWTSDICCTASSHPHQLPPRTMTFGPALTIDNYHRTLDTSQTLILSPECYSRTSTSIKKL